MPPEPRTLKTERLLLEPKRAEHGDLLVPVVESSMPELRKWMSWAAKWDPDENLAHARDSEEWWRRGDGWEFVMVHNGELAGGIGLHGYDAQCLSASLGYWIRSDLAGQGLVTEAGRAVIKFGFEVVGLVRIELVADLDNHASWRIAEKLGMQREGIKRGGTLVGGKLSDAYLYGLLASDPRPK